jgi:hypothetical protein
MVSKSPPLRRQQPVQQVHVSLSMPTVQGARQAADFALEDFARIIAYPAVRENRAVSFFRNRSEKGAAINGLPVAHRNFRQYAGSRCANFVGQAVGVDFDQRLVAADWIPNALEPSPDRQLDVGLYVGWYSYFRYH